MIISKSPKLVKGLKNFITLFIIFQPKFPCETFFIWLCSCIAYLSCFSSLELAFLTLQGNKNTFFFKANTIQGLGMAALTWNKSVSHNSTFTLWFQNLSLIKCNAARAYSKHAMWYRTDSIVVNVHLLCLNHLSNLQNYSHAIVDFYQNHRKRSKCAYVANFKEILNALLGESWLEGEPSKTNKSLLAPSYSWESKKKEK